MNAFVFEAKDELDLAVAAADVDAVEAARAKELLMCNAAWKDNWLGDAELMDFVRHHGNAAI